jgi:phospholipid/cholesterol/gamma-HCH transport system substrate-binding protein
MKISNETKVGALTAIAITLLILGFNFLKGKTLFKTGNYILAHYTDTKGLMVSNAVYINGFQVGSVSDIENADKNLSSIVVTIKLKDNYNIPTNSLASIKESPLGAPSVIITPGNSTVYLKTGDSIPTASNPGLLADVMNKLTPVTDQVKVTLHSLDSVLNNINTIFDPNTKNNLQQVIANINKTTASLAVSSASIQAMMNEQTGAITQSMNNVASFTKNLSDNNEKVTRMLTNVETTTSNFSKADIAGSVDQLKATIGRMNGILEKISSSDGSLGKLMNDKTLYNNLSNTVRSANILLDDLRLHPKRYVNISVFGRKDKDGPLLAPLPVDSTQK